MWRTTMRRKKLDDDYASYVVRQPFADAFVKALDALGWMIVPQPQRDCSDRSGGGRVTAGIDP